MFRWSFFFCCCLFCTTAINAQLSGIPLVDSLMKSALPETGTSALVIIKDGKTVFNKNYAAQQTTNEKIRISNAGKWLAAATLLTLVDDGLIALDDEIGKFFPQLKGESAAITLRQLLSHTSGLPPNSVFIKDVSINLAQSVDSIFRKVSLANSPGTQFSYGGISYQIAGRLAEVVSGKDWETLFKEKIAVPCEMTQTDFGNKKNKDIGEGAYSTATDYSNFLLMLLNNGVYKGKRVLSAQMIQEMLTDQTSQLDLGYTPYRFKSVRQSKFYGLGVWLDRITVDGNQTTEAGCPGAKGFFPWMNLCKNLAGVYAFYTDISRVKPLIEKTKSIIDESFAAHCIDYRTENAPQKENQIFTLEQNFPNPAAQLTQIAFRIDREAFVNLKLFDPLGNEIMLLMNAKMKAGDYSIPVDASSLKSGIYFYRLLVNDRSETKKLTIKN